jgi:membrane protein YqaA with SNARE-associated domain
MVIAAPGRLASRPYNTASEKPNRTSLVGRTHNMHGTIVASLLAKKSGGISHAVLRWLRHLGGPGLILLGIIDNSVVPMPGSLDAVTVVLAANQHDWWPYYAVMATVGALIGGYLTYRIAQKESKDELKKRVPADKMRKVERTFKRWGFAAIVIIAILPPPAPMVPFLLAAGAAQYPRKKFIGALALGRGIRYAALAYLASIYGKTIMKIISNHLNVLIVLAALSIGGGIAAALYLRFRRKSPHKKKRADRKG